MRDSIIAKHLPKSRSFLAMIVGSDGQTRKEIFPDELLATKWLEGEGAASFQGKIERLELYNEYKVLIWAKSPG
ncbi:MAG: hypothetical protein WAU74_16835 [Pseudolabrys sp.]